MAPDPALLHRCERMAELLVQAGRVVPALVRDGDGQLRARWWPLPAAEDRPWLEAMLPADDLASQQQLAEALAAAVAGAAAALLDIGAVGDPALLPAGGSGFLPAAAQRPEPGPAAGVAGPQPGSARQQAGQDGPGGGRRRPEFDGAVSV
jgi:hypothetical protein